MIKKQQELSDYYVKKYSFISQDKKQEIEQIIRSAKHIISNELLPIIENNIGPITIQAQFAILFGTFIKLIEKNY